MKSIVAIAAVVVGSSVWAARADAGELHGRVAALNLEKGTIGIDVEGREQGLPLAKECKVYRKAGGRSDAVYNEAPEGLKAITIGDEVIAATELTEGQEQVVRIKIETIPRRGRHVGRDVSGKVAAIDAKKGTISLSATDKDQVYILSKDVNVYQRVGSGARGHFIPAPGGLDDVTVGADVILNLDTRDGKERVAYIEVGAGEKKPKKPAK